MRRSHPLGLFSPTVGRWKIGFPGIARMQTEKSSHSMFRVVGLYLLPFAWLIGLVLLWQIGVTISGAANPLYPGPAQVIEVLWDDLVTGLLPIDLAWSLMRVAIGFTVGALLGLACGIATAKSLALNRTIGLNIEIMQASSPYRSRATVRLMVWVGRVFKGRINCCRRTPGSMDIYSRRAQGSE